MSDLVEGAPPPPAPLVSWVDDRPGTREWCRKPLKTFVSRPEMAILRLPGHGPGSR